MKYTEIKNYGKIIIGVVAFIGAVALTIATGGALAPMFITLGISLASGTLIGGFGAVISSGGDWSQFGKGAFDGFSDGMLWGGIFALGGAAIRTMRILKRGVVIGESMSRVDAAAKQIGALTYKAPGQNIVKILGKAKAFELNKALNKAWIKRMARWGVKIYDIGLDFTRATRSPFYAIEATVTADYWNLFEVLF